MTTVRLRLVGQDTGGRDPVRRHLRAAEIHAASAARHERAVGFWDQRGDAERARLERRAAAIEREAEQLERDRAQLENARDARRDA